MSICEKKGHRYYQGTRKVSGWLTPYEENILYCGRCGHIIPIDMPYQGLKLGGSTAIPLTNYSITLRYTEPYVQDH